MKNQTFPKKFIFLMAPVFIAALIIISGPNIQPDHASAMSLPQSLFETIKSNPADDPVMDSKKNQNHRIPRLIASRMSSIRGTFHLLSI